MKIITDKAAYVQKNDITYLNRTDLEIPVSIFMKVFENGIVIIDDSNRYDFVEFNKPEEIAFFRSISWMIDYDEVKDLSEEECISLGQSIAEERNLIARNYNSMPVEEKKQNTNMVFQCELLDFKMNSLKDFLQFKQGHLQIKLPEQVDLPTGFVPQKGIRKLIRNIFKKKDTD